MKKILCWMLALVLTAGLAFAGLAEAAQGADVNAPNALQSASDPVAQLPADAVQPSDVADPGAEETLPPDAATTPAVDRTVDIDGQYTLVCPGSLTPIDVTQQDMDGGLLFSAYNDTMGVDVYKYPQGEDTLDSLYATYKADEGMSEVTLADVGGVKVLVYRMTKPASTPPSRARPAPCTTSCSPIRPRRSTRSWAR
jgi:hypothetical protein